MYGSVLRAQFLAVVRRPNVSDGRQAGAVGRRQMIAIAIVHLRNVSGGRAVHVQRRPRQDAVAHPAAQVVDDDLGAPEAEGGNQHLAAAGQGAADHVAHAGRQAVHALVDAAAVGAFADEQVGRRYGRRLAQERQAAPTEVAGEGDAADARRPGDRQLGHRRAEDVTGVEEAQPDVRGNVVRRLVGDGHALQDDAVGVGARVRRRVGRGAPTPTLPQPRREGRRVGDDRFLFPDAGRIAEHDGGQLAGGRGAVDGAGKALIDQAGQVAAVVDVGVAEDDGVDVGRGEGKADVASASLVAFAANEAAIEQDALTGRLHQMHRSCHRLGRAPKRDARTVGG